MKTLLLFAVVLFLSFSFVQAQEKVQVDKNGEIRIVQEDGREWRDLTEAEEKAYANPGTQVPTGSYSTSFERLDFFHYQKVREYEKVVVFTLSRFQTFEIQTIERGEVEFYVYVVFILMAIIFMAIFHLGIKRKNKMLDYFGFIAFIFTAFAFIATPSPRYILLVFTTIALVTSAIIVVNVIKYYTIAIYIKFTLLLFYLSAIVSLFV